MSVRIALLRGAVVIGAVLVWLVPSTAHAATVIEPPFGVMIGTAASPSYLQTLTIDARGEGGTATLTRGDDVRTIMLDCVRTYGVIGIVPSVPMVGEYGYATGVDDYGQRWWIYINEGLGISVDTEPGPPVRSIDTCGVGYRYAEIAATGIAIVPQATTVWTPVG